MSANDRAVERHVRRDGYELTYYPGFCSRASVRDADGRQHELFAQTETFHLPRHESRPATRHRLALKGGPAGQDVTLEIHDPYLRIARIRIELYESRIATTDRAPTTSPGRSSR